MLPDTGSWHAHTHAHLICARGNIRWPAGGQHGTVTQSHGRTRAQRTTAQHSPPVSMKCLCASPDRGAIQTGAGNQINNRAGSVPVSKPTKVYHMYDYRIYHEPHQRWWLALNCSSACSCCVGSEHHHCWALGACALSMQAQCSRDGCSIVQWQQQVANLWAHTGLASPTKTLHINQHGSACCA